MAAALTLLSWRGGVCADVSGLPARPSPDWLRRATIYEVFPRDFSDAGNLNGVTKRLDELHKLGVNILWTMPVHPIGEKFRKGEFGSPYSIRDYYAIDGNYGTVADLTRLVSAAHKRGMRVIMDLVADHTAWDSVMMRHPEFYKHDTQGNVISPVPEWTDVAALNYDNPALREYMIDMLKFWVKTCDVDGFRCDAAAMVPTEFWEQVRVELGGMKPDILMLAEASKPELLVNAFDFDYSWPLLSAVKDVFLHNAPASNIRRSWEESRAQFPKDALHMRISDDHDEARAVGSFGFDGGLAASALMFTLDGVPLIYNGMETGDTNASDGGALFDKRNIAWQSKEHRELFGTYHDLIRLREKFGALRTSNVEWLHNTDETNLVTFLRKDDKDQLLIVINFSNQRRSGGVGLADAAGFKPVKISGLESTRDTALPAIQLNQYQWRVYHRPTPAARKMAGVFHAKN
jgi:glycosidase